MKPKEWHRRTYSPKGYLQRTETRRYRLELAAEIQRMQLAFAYERGFADGQATA